MAGYGESLWLLVSLPVMAKAELMRERWVAAISMDLRLDLGRLKSLELMLCFLCMLTRDRMNYIQRE